MRKVTVSRMRERYAQTVLTFQITYVQYVCWYHCYVGPVCMQCNTEQYNKLLVNCAFAGTLHK